MGKVLTGFIIFFHVLPLALLGFIYMNADVSRQYANSECLYPQAQLHKLNLGFAIFFLTIFLVGLMTIICQFRRLQIIYVAVLLMSPFVFTWFIESRVRDGQDYVDSEKKIERDYLLHSYPKWAQKFIITPNDWNAFTSCMVGKEVCPKLKNWDIFQDGCCNPPIYCGYQDQNHTWVVPENGLYSKDRECTTWSNDSRRRCFSCESCKAAYIHRFTYIWMDRGFYMWFACIPLFFCFIFTFEDDNNSTGKKKDRV